MDDNRLPVGSVLAPLLYFAITTTMAIILLVTALVIWIAEITGSATLSTLIVGAGFVFVAWLIYVLSIRRCVA